MIHVIVAPNSRPACGGPHLIRYSAAGVFLALAKKGLDVHYFDLMSDKKENLSRVPQENSADVCCYAVFFGNKKNAFSYMGAVRRARKMPRFIIAFGPFASVFSEEILTRGLADIVVASDPEFVIPEVLQHGDNIPLMETIPNLSYIDEGKIIHTPKYSFPDLDAIPFIGPYLYAQGHRPAFIITARGCQYHCVFCDRNVLWGGGVRNRSVANVLSEIRELVEIHRVKEIRFLDEDLAADKKRLMSLCEGMKHIKRGFFWECSACVNSVTRKLLLLMAYSRCKTVYLGVESASPRVLRRIGKRYGRQEILDAIRWGQEAGLRVEVMITIGNPGETDGDRDMTLSLLEEMERGVNVVTNRLVTLPGTALYRKGLREGLYTPKSFFEDEGLIFCDAKNK